MQNCKARGLTPEKAKVKGREFACRWWQDAEAANRECEEYWKAPPLKLEEDPYEAAIGSGGAASGFVALYLVVALFGWIFISVGQDYHEKTELLTTLHPELPKLAAIYYESKDSIEEGPFALGEVDDLTPIYGPRKKLRSIQATERAVVLEAADEIQERKHAVDLRNLLMRLPAGNRATQADFSEKRAVTIFLLGPPGELKEEGLFREGRRVLVVAWPEKTILLNATVKSGEDEEGKIWQWIYAQLPPSTAPWEAPSLSTVWAISFAVVGAVAIAIFGYFKTKNDQRRRLEQLARLNAEDDYDLLDLYALGFVLPTGKGSDITYIDAEVQNLTDKEFWVTIPVGVYFLASGSHQNMATRTEHRFRLKGSAVVQLRVPASCINAERAIPNSKDSFSGVAKVPDHIARFLSAASRENAMVVQAGVWALTDNLTQAEVQLKLRTKDAYGQNISAISNAQVAKAKRILEELKIPNRL